MGADDRNSFADPLLPMRNIKLCHLHMWLILTLKDIKEMRAEEGKRQIFTCEIFVHTSEKNTKGGKYNSLKGLYPQKCLCISLKSTEIKLRYTAYR